MRNASAAYLLVLVSVAMLGTATGALAQADVKLISQGRQVNLEEHLVPGKLVIFDFFADWCAPCRQLTPRLERLAAQYPDRVALRKVDVIDWESPVSRQFRIGSLPYLALYNGDGRQLAMGDANRVLRVLGTHLDGSPISAKRVGRRSAVPTPVWLTFIVAMVVGSLVLRARGKRGAPGPGGSAEPASMSEENPPRIWFALLQGGLDGPYSAEQLETLRASGELTSETRIRRRGESSWRRLDDVVGRT